MPRALAIRHVRVPADARAPYLARLAARRESARACGYNCWAFERDGAPGEFVEFVEASGRAALDAALVQDRLYGEGLDWQHPPAAVDPEPAVYLEVDVTDVAPR